MLSDRQEKFCQLIALYGFTYSEAAKEAGYKGTSKSAYWNIGKRLIDNIHIASRIDELRESFFDVDAVRKSIILQHMQARTFKVTDYVHHALVINDNGKPFYRLVVKPYEEWDEVGKRMCVGFDKNNIPLFRSGQDATKELCKIFGIYKENSVSKEEDTTGVLADSGLNPSGSVVSEYQGISYEEEFDGSALDRELGMPEEEEESEESEDEESDESDESDESEEESEEQEDFVDDNFYSDIYSDLEVSEGDNNG